MISGKDSTVVSEEECNEKLRGVTRDMVKVYDYSEGECMNATNNSDWCGCEAE
jgi:hypothetical protein